MGACWLPASYHADRHGLACRLSAEISYLTGLALPMVLIGIGQGGSLSPLTASGIVRVNPEDASAASGLINVAHQLGVSLGLGVLVAVFAAAGSAAPNAQELLADRISTSLLASMGMLAVAFILVIALIVQTRKAEWAAAAKT